MSSATVVVLIVETRDARPSELRDGLDPEVQVLEAEDLRAAREQARRNEGVDLLISDLRGTGAQGPSLYRRIRADPILEAAPLLLIVPPPAAKEESDDSKGLLPESVDPQELCHLVGHHLAAQDAAVERPGPKAPLEKRIRTVVEARLSDPDFTAGTLAEALDLSRRHLTRRMKEAMGTTPAAFIRARRIERAKTVLEAGAETVAEVASAVGFRSPSAFSKAFREEVGCPPSAHAERQEG